MIADPPPVEVSTCEDQIDGCMVHKNGHEVSYRKGLDLMSFRRVAESGDAQHHKADRQDPLA